MSSTPFSTQRDALNLAFAKHDKLVAAGADSLDIAVAEHQIYLASKALTMQLTHPGVFALSQVFQAMIHAAVVVAGQLNIFDIVEEETSIEQIAKQTGADELLILRILRVLSSSDILVQPTRTTFVATPFSRKFRERSARNWAPASLTFMNAACIKLPEALREDSYRNPEDIMKCAGTKVNGRVMWEMLAEDPERGQMFDYAMEQQDDLPPAMIVDEMVDWEGMLGGVGEGEVAFVDVGGGSGHAIVKVRERLRDRVKGRYILQDREGAIETGLRDYCGGSEKPFEGVPMDFFKEQPVKGARVYHIRRCLHDWSDTQCEVILRNVRGAMKLGYSRLLIHEFVLPVVGAEQREVLFDVLMMCLTGAERDELQWQTLLERSGMKIVKIWRAKIGHVAVIEAEAV